MDMETGDNHQPHRSNVIHDNGTCPANSSDDHQTLSPHKPLPTKGFGLKKWRRIKRDFLKDASASLDATKPLKRASSAPSNPAKPRTPLPDAFPLPDSRLDSTFALASATYSGNSEDRSSKSSTAASAPKPRHDLPSVTRDKTRPINPTGRSSTQKVQGGKARLESSKKHRGDRIKIDQENSHSSVDSDSRSSNSVFMHPAFPFTGNGNQSATSVNFGGENSDEALASEQYSEEVQTGYRKEAVGEVEQVSHENSAADMSWQARVDKGANNRPSSDQDPLVQSILVLQSVQEALEKEVQKLGEIGKEAASVQDNLVHQSTAPVGSTCTDPEVHEPCSSDQLASERASENASTSLETQVATLMESVKHLESKLEEAKALHEFKESRISELEAAINNSKSTKEETHVAKTLQKESFFEIESELEGLFQQRIEAEIEYLALTRMIEKLRVAAVGEQSVMLNKFGETRKKGAVLKKEAEDTRKYCGEILVGEEVMKLQKRVVKFCSCFVIQLMLLVLVFWQVLSEVSPERDVVVPT